MQNLHAKSSVASRGVRVSTCELCRRMRCTTPDRMMRMCQLSIQSDAVYLCACRQKNEPNIKSDVTYSQISEIRLSLLLRLRSSFSRIAGREFRSRVPSQRFPSEETSGEERSDRLCFGRAKRLRTILYKPDNATRFANRIAPVK